MALEDIYGGAKERMEKAVEVLKDEFRRVRTGRASTALVENIKVDYYGTATPLRQLANISTPDPRLIVIRPYDPSCVHGIEKAILQSDIGITPSTDQKIVKLPVPPLSEERRKQLSGMARKLAEESKVAIRNVLRDALTPGAVQENDSEISEDQAFKAKEKIQELTDKHIQEIDAICKVKTAEIMEM